jgi:hypothetical protein
MNLELQYTLPKDFLRNILISAFESGVHGSHCWVDVVECRDTHAGGYDALYIKYDRKGGDEGSRKGRRVLDLEDVREGIRRLLASPKIKLHSSYRGRIAAAVVNQDSGEIDGELADYIVQAAVYNDHRL